MYSFKQSAYKLCLAPPDNAGGGACGQNYQNQVSVTKSTIFGNNVSNFLSKIYTLPKKSTFRIFKFLDKEKIQAGLKYLVSTNVIQLWIDKSKNQENTISNILTNTFKNPNLGLNFFSAGSLRAS